VFDAPSDARTTIRARIACCKDTDGVLNTARSSDSSSSDNSIVAALRATQRSYAKSLTYTSYLRRGALGAEQAAALRCADGPARQGPRAWPRIIGRLARVSPIGGRLFGWSFWAPCASWPAPSSERYTGPWNATTTNPILVIGTRFDPVTPFANARRAARRLGNAVLLIHDGYGHTSGADPSACVDAATSVYLVNLTTPPCGTVCPSDRQPFDPNFGKPLPVSTGGFRP
jgi:pimeloyl-ACP methyl ester carboxylesterase